MNNMNILLKIFSGCPHSVIVKVLDFNLKVSDFELHSYYYVHF